MKVASIIITIFLIASSVGIATQKRDIIVPDDYPTIQEAINNANEGDRIFVRSGLYKENVLINKDRIMLYGEKNATIDGNGNNVITIYANFITIHGFKIINSGYMNSGIYIDGSHCYIGNNVIENNGYAICLNYSCNNVIGNNTISHNYKDGICLYNSENNIMDNNTILSNWNGIVMWNCYNNTIERNNIENGTFLYNSTKNIIRNNFMNGSDGLFLYYSNNNSIDANTISNDGVGMLLWYSCNNKMINNEIFNNEYGIWLCNNSNDNIISNNIIASNNRDGIYLILSNKNEIANNIITSNNKRGVSLMLSNRNRISSNNITSNGKYGVYLYYSNCNFIWRNNFIDNDAFFENSFFNLWLRNFWYNWIGIIPKVIQGRIKIRYDYYSWYAVDWFPKVMPWK